MMCPSGEGYVPLLKNILAKQFLRMQLIGRALGLMDISSPAPARPDCAVCRANRRQSISSATVTTAFEGEPFCQFDIDRQSNHKMAQPVFAGKPSSPRGTQR